MDSGGPMCHFNLSSHIGPGPICQIAILVPKSILGPNISPKSSSSRTRPSFHTFRLTHSHFGSQFESMSIKISLQLNYKGIINKEFQGKLVSYKSKVKYFNLIRQDKYIYILDSCPQLL